MEIQITKNTILKDENLLVLGAVGSGKSRHFITPVITSNKDANFILLTAKDEGLGEIFNKDCFYDTTNLIDFKKVNFNKPIILNYPMSTNKYNNITEANVYNLLCELIKTDLNKPTFVILDGFGLFSFPFFKKVFIKELNEKNIYFAFVLQNYEQVNFVNSEIANICKKYLLLSKDKHEIFTYNTNDNFKSCYIFENNKTMADEKLDPIDSTRLKFYRIKAGLTQIELAEKSDVSLRNIRAIEKDASKVQKLQALNLYKISKVLNCKMEDLLEL